jgi:hypothetical protein
MFSTESDEVERNMTRTQNEKEEEWKERTAKDRSIRSEEKFFDICSTMCKYLFRAAGITTYLRKPISQRLADSSRDVLIPNSDVNPYSSSSASICENEERRLDTEIRGVETALGIDGQRPSQRVSDPPSKSSYSPYSVSSVPPVILKPSKLSTGQQYSLDPYSQCFYYYFLFAFVNPSNLIIFSIIYPFFFYSFPKRS